MICPYCNKELEYTGIPDCHRCTNPKCFMSYYEDVENVIWRDLIANKKTSEALRWTRNVLSAIYLKTGNEWIQEILIEIRNLMLGVSIPYKYVLFKPVRDKILEYVEEIEGCCVAIQQQHLPQIGVDQKAPDAINQETTRIDEIMSEIRTLLTIKD